MATTSATGLARGITDENSKAGGFLATTNDLIARERAITFNTGDNDESNPVMDRPQEWGIQQKCSLLNT